MRTRPFKGNLMAVKLLDTSPWIKRLTKVIFALLRVLDKASRGHQHILESPFGRHELTNKLLWERTCLLVWPFKKDFGLHISMVKAVKISSLIKCIYGLYCMCPASIVRVYIWSYGCGLFLPHITATKSHSCVKSFEPEKATFPVGAYPQSASFHSVAWDWLQLQPLSKFNTFHSQVFANLWSHNYHNVMWDIHSSFWFQCIRQMGWSI